VVVYDGRGNGRSDRPAGAAAYADEELVDDAVAVLDEVGADRAVVVGLSLGGRTLLALAAAHPDRVSGAVFVGPSVDLEDRPAEERAEFFVERDVYDGWDRWNANYWRQDLAGFAEFFFGEAFPEAHSTRQVEDAVSWALDTDGETLVATKSLAPSIGAREARAAAAAVSCPTLVIHGDSDRIVPWSRGHALAEALGCPLDTVVGGGHCVQARHPVWFNLRLRRFLEQVAG
jgi:pimeloyl-ACP methyl ester carboxylesterase